MLPIHPTLEALAAVNIPPDAPAFMPTPYGKAYNASGFTNYFATCVRKAGIKILSGC